MQLQIHNIDVFDNEGQQVVVLYMGWVEFGLWVPFIF